MAFKFTQGQSQAIHESGHDILVSASAGSGKTRVLVERVVDKIKHGIDVDRLLILTFTEAAAREMKERIQKALREACNQTEDEHQKVFLIFFLTLSLIFLILSNLHLLIHLNFLYHKI